MNEKAHSFLVQWTINFVKHKDTLAKKIEKIEKNKDNFDLYVKYKDREHYIIVAPQLKDIDSIIKKISNNAINIIIKLDKIVSPADGKLVNNLTI